MFKKIEKPAACGMWSVIHFLNARNMKLANIEWQLCEVYGEHAMSDSVVRKWVRHFNEECENVHDDPWSGKPSVVNEDLLRAVEEKIQGNR
jgi:transposase